MLAQLHVPQSLADCVKGEVYIRAVEVLIVRLKVDGIGTQLKQCQLMQEARTSHKSEYHFD
jgi:hypothetical protein